MITTMTNDKPSQYGPGPFYSRNRYRVYTKNGWKYMRNNEGKGCFGKAKHNKKGKKK